MVQVIMVTADDCPPCKAFKMNHIGTVNTSLRNKGVKNIRANLPSRSSSIPATVPGFIRGAITMFPFIGVLPEGATDVSQMKVFNGKMSTHQGRKVFVPVDSGQFKAITATNVIDFVMKNGGKPQSAPISNSQYKVRSRPAVVKGNLTNFAPRGLYD